MTKLPQAKGESRIAQWRKFAYLRRRGGEVEGPLDFEDGETGGGVQERGERV